ncbi:protein FAM193B [Anguilla anguilla]|uniref:protein FAM193B n=1 Tax=Anguilla anguilla TaxID=7936 RepID=UPI0015AFAD67|nr:protein FAM193B [Anguilla anguilla]
MARKKSKQQGVGNKELISGQQSLSKSPVSPGDAAGGGGDGDAGLERLARANQPLPLSSGQPMHTCCLLCHREFKDWGAGPANGLPPHGAKVADGVPALSQALLREVPGRKLADAVPSLSQSLLGEVPLWICQSCRKSVEEEERRATQEQTLPVPLSHASSCKAQACGNGYPEPSAVEWDPSSFLSAHKLSGLWNSAHSNGGGHCNHGAGSHSQQGGLVGPPCMDKRGPHEAPGKSAKPSGAKVCPYSHPSSQNPSGTSAGSSLSPGSADLCKTTPKHFKNMCRRPTPPGEAFHSSDHHQHSDLAAPPNSPTGLSSHHSSLLPPAQHAHAAPPGPALSSHAPFAPLVSKLSAGSDCSPASLHKPAACKNSHIPAVSAPHAKLGPAPLGCSHPCNGHSNGAVSSSNTGHLPASTCRDQACKGHKLANGTVCHPPCELEEGEDEDSSSERSSCASSSTNQKDGKYCDCCYCEFFGHNAPPAAPTSRNYAEIREKLRSRLTRRKEELPQRQDSDPAAPSAIDHRDVDELLDFINSTEPKPVNSAKAAKRARHKQKKKEKEKAAQGSPEAPGDDPRASPLEVLEEVGGAAEGEGGRLLEWPQLELERVNSFLTSRLEEIKNTIKDSIRASFSMYDLNLDVNDFPKKAATLEGNHLLSHLNGSSELQQIDLDLSPLSLSSFKSHLELVNGWEDRDRDRAPSPALSPSPSPSPAPSPSPSPSGQDVQRLQATPSLSKLIRVRSSPERGPPAHPAPTLQGPAPKAQEDAEARAPPPPGGKARKGKKQQQQQQQEPPQLQDPQQAKLPRAAPGNEPHRSRESQAKQAGSKPGSRAPPQCQTPAGKRPEECPGGDRGEQAPGGPKHSRVDQEPEGRAAHPAHAGSQQPKGKSKKNKNKADKASSSIDDVFLPKDLDPTEMDEIDREVEYFKRFCLDSAKQTRQKVAVNWSNFSLKKVPSNAAQ